MATKRSRIFDTNIWVAYFDEDDSTHNRAIQMIDNDRLRSVLPEYVFLELCTVLKKRTNHEFVSRVVDLLCNTEAVTLLSSTEYFSETVSLFQTLDEPHLSFVDVSLVVLSRNYEVMTFDTKLQRAIKHARPL